MLHQMYVGVVLVALGLVLIWDLEGGLGGPLHQLVTAPPLPLPTYPPNPHPIPNPKIGLCISLYTLLCTPLTFLYSEGGRSKRASGEMCGWDRGWGQSMKNCGFRVSSHFGNPFLFLVTFGQPFCRFWLLFCPSPY